MEKELVNLFKRKKSEILNIYFTAGFPSRDDTIDIIIALQEAGVDIVEIGAPYSDPLADGETIQMSSSKALKNGINLDLVLDQIKRAKDRISIPMVLMGYFNQFMQYGFEKLLKNMHESGIEALIIPDMPEDYYELNYKALFEKHGIKICFLITPETDETRVRKLDSLSTGFLYMVAQSSTTGGTAEETDSRIQYFKRIKDMNLASPRLIGFGIHDKASFDKACTYAGGAIIGSAFIRMLDTHGLEGIPEFISTIRKEN